jgi:hypothetical protein
VLTSTSRPPSPLRGVVMNLKNMTMVLIITLVYEVILKSAHTLTPSFFDIRQVTGVVTGLRYVTGVIVVVFIYLFYRAEGQPRLVGQGLRLLLLCVAVSLVLRLPVIDRGMSRLSVRVASQTIGLAISALLFVVIVAYRRCVGDLLPLHVPAIQAGSVPGPGTVRRAAPALPGRLWLTPGREAAQAEPAEVCLSRCLSVRPSAGLAAVGPDSPKLIDIMRVTNYSR